MHHLTLELKPAHKRNCVDIGTELELRNYLARQGLGDTRYCVTALPNSTFEISANNEGLIRSIQQKAQRNFYAERAHSGGPVKRRVLTR